MDTQQYEDEPASLPMRFALGHWVVCLFLLLAMGAVSVGLVMMSVSAVPFVLLLGVTAYCVMGFYLYSVMLKQIVTTAPLLLYGIASDKTKFILFWPVMYYLLISKLSAKMLTKHQAPSTKHQAPSTKHQ